MNNLTECEECGSRSIAMDDLHEGALVVCAECECPRGIFPVFFDAIRERVALNDNGLQDSSD